MAEMMRSLKTKNGNYLVDCEKTDGVPRWGYFKESGQFIRYADQNEWKKAVNNWEAEMEEKFNPKFILPPLSSWGIRNFSKSDAGNIVVCWKWRPGSGRKIQQSYLMLGGKIILRNEDTEFSLTKEAVIKVNIIHKWRCEGFNKFTYEDALNYELCGGGWYLPTTLTNLCYTSGYNKLMVRRAVEFIGTQEPESYSIALKKREGEDKPYAIEFSYIMTSGRSENYLLHLDKMADANTSNLECLSNCSITYKGLLWMILNPIKERVEKLKTNP